LHATWTQQRVTERIAAWALAHDGYGPRIRDWKSGGHPDWSEGEWPSANAVTRHFPRWLDALDAAGVTQRPRNPRVRSLNVAAV
jgi:hypothetical protein